MDDHIIEDFNALKFKVDTLQSSITRELHDVAMSHNSLESELYALKDVVYKMILERQSVEMMDVENEKEL